MYQSEIVRLENKIMRRMPEHYILYVQKTASDMQMTDKQYINYLKTQLGEY